MDDAESALKVVNSLKALGVKSSSATGSYRGDGDVRVEIKIADASGVSGLMDLAGSLASNQTSESDSGYEKDVTIGGRSGSLKRLSEKPLPCCFWISLRILIHW